MNKNEKNDLVFKRELYPDDAKYSDDMNIDYCKYRLSALAKKIKSEYLKYKKSETRLINP